MPDQNSSVDLLDSRPAAPPATTVVHTITLTGTGGTPMTFPCAEDDVLVRAALRAGIDFPYECNMGGCGACKLQLAGGEVATVWPDAAGLSDRDRRRGNVLGCQARPLGDCSITLRGEPSVAIPREQRPRRRKAVLVGRRLLSPTMVELDFTTDDDAIFLPGQYALLGLPGLAGERAYSMANAANTAGQWRFIVRRVPTGAASPFLFDELEVGAAVTLDAPYGRAYWKPQPRRAVCIAGGSGLAPMIAIATAAKAARQQVEFFYGTRDAADVAAVEAMGLWGETVSLRTAVSDPPPGWSGGTGFVHEAVAAAIPPEAAETYEYYVAGPAPMTEAVLKLLMIERKVPFDQIHYDRFV
jgi:toluene monooxygenase electron transfer component